MAKEVRRTIVRFDEEVRNLLEAAIKTSGRTMTAIVNEAVRQYLQDEQNADDRFQEIEKRLTAIEERLGISRQ